MLTVNQNHLSASTWMSGELYNAQGHQLGLYIHLPYCRTKCTYCAFVSAPPQSESEMDDYADAVKKHLIAGSKCAEERTVNTVFFGGGTPSLMGGERISKLLQCIQQQYTLANDVEITLEANPESATQELFERIVPLGVNRISMGAQSFNDAELVRIGRVHNAEIIPTAVMNAKQSGIENVSLDLIYGLPEQRFEQWEQSIHKAMDCGLTHLSAYGLTYEEGTLLHRQLVSGVVTTLHEDTYVDMYEYLQECMEQKGYNQYEISNWCLPGYECRHNMIYWNRDDYLAFGVSAHGLMKGLKYSINPSPKQYIQYFQLANDFQQTNEMQSRYFVMDIVQNKTEFTAKEAAEDAMIFGLRKTKGVNLTWFKDRFGYSPLDRWGQEIQSFIHLDWLEQNNGYLRLTKSAYLISNEVMQAFVE